LSYAELAKFFLNQPNPSAQEIFDAVCQIRRKKLPDPKLLGNAGSFFHNPQVSESTYLALRDKFPDIVAFAGEAIHGLTRYKLAAGWLIDQCGLKGYRQGDVGVYDQQALVLVNYGSGTGQDILALARMIQEKIHAVYGVDLTYEPVIIPAQ
jgi:UDP-N-acetylmuramate dehydrogenase